MSHNYRRGRDRSNDYNSTSRSHHPYENSRDNNQSQFSQYDRRPQNTGNDTYYQQRYSRQQQPQQQQQSHYPSSPRDNDRHYNSNSRYSSYNNNTNRQDSRSYLRRSSPSRSRSSIRSRSRSPCISRSVSPAPRRSRTPPRRVRSRSNSPVRRNYHSLPPSNSYATNRLNNLRNNYHSSSNSNDNVYRNRRKYNNDYNNDLRTASKSAHRNFSTDGDDREFKSSSKLETSQASLGSGSFQLNDQVWDCPPDPPGDGIIGEIDYDIPVKPQRTRWPAKKMRQKSNRQLARDSTMSDEDGGDIDGHRENDNDKDDKETHAMKNEAQGENDKNNINNSNLVNDSGTIQQIEDMRMSPKGVKRKNCDDENEDLDINKNSNYNGSPENRSPKRTRRDDYQREGHQEYVETKTRDDQMDRIEVDPRR